MMVRSDSISLIPRAAVCRRRRSRCRTSAGRMTRPQRRAASTAAGAGPTNAAVAATVMSASAAPTSQPNAVRPLGGAGMWGTGLSWSRHLLTCGFPRAWRQHRGCVRLSHRESRVGAGQAVRASSDMGEGRRGATCATLVSSESASGHLSVVSRELTSGRASRAVDHRLAGFVRVRRWAG